MGKEVIGAMFSDVRNMAQNESNRFSSKQLEGLDYLIGKTTDFIDHGVNALRSYRYEGGDAKKLYDMILVKIVDLACAKTLVENITSLEVPEEIKKFSLKPLLVSITDWISRDIVQKDINLSLIYSPDIPPLICAPYSLMKSLIYNILRFIERGLEKGNITISCETEKNEDAEQDDKNSLYLKFTFQIESKREKDLPPNEFMNFVPNATFNQIKLPDSGSANKIDKMEEKIPMWLNEIRDLIHYTATNQSSGVKRGDMP